MIKLVSLFTRRSGLSMAEFKAYYEEEHVPLVTRLLPSPTDYRRSYVVEGTTYAAAHIAPDRPTDRRFDVLVELTYADGDHFQTVMDALADPRVGPVIAADEERFLNRSTMQTFFVEEVRG